MKFLIVDDHSILRKGVVQILKSHFTSAKFFEASDGAQAIRTLRENDIDLTFMDISMPKTDGIEVLKQVNSLGIDCPIIILSMQSEEQYALRAIRAGAKGYLNKNAKSETIIKAVNKVLSGKNYVSENVAEILIDSVGKKSTETLHELLSDREMQVLHHLGKGKTISEIAREINLNVNTISTYRIRILDKLGLKNNAALIKYAIDNKLD